MDRLDSSQEAEESQNAFPLNLTVELNSNKLAQKGQENITHGGLKLMRLAGRDAEVRLYPQIIKARITAAEQMTLEAKFFQALYEIGDLTGSGILRRPQRPKPFNLSMTIPRFLEPSIQTVLPATAENLASGFPDLFMDDEETSRLRDALAFSLTDSGTPPSTELVLETPEMGIHEAQDTPLIINSFGKQFGYDLQMRELDLATAIQLAAQKIAPIEQGSPTILLTNRKTNDSKRIAVSSIPTHKIMLREVTDEKEARSALREIVFNTATQAVSTTAVFRRLA